MLLIAWLFLGLFLMLLIAWLFLGLFLGLLIAWLFLGLFLGLLIAWLFLGLFRGLLVALLCLVLFKCVVAANIIAARQGLCFRHDAQSLQALEICSIIIVISGIEQCWCQGPRKDSCLKPKPARLPYGVTRHTVTLGIEGPDSLIAIYNISYNCIYIYIDIYIYLYVYIYLHKI